ncbi:LacI family transcriptional regulator [Amycolatopsis balhimycina DSM 5908]|uniref:LacI family transcriptional regulator n=1 Tax=Amycolatopsis balhimycina DSM 5908 TaxID=1081091 RepID=A0A428WUD5_AMYBA|nr:substrate-binding domain-containing protein [Amycolatopsis balhimycina]RSM46662.1 LacI family transcriptional regulator [Amycolatopsis balhimycina DSM 5908]
MREWTTGEALPGGRAAVLPDPARAIGVLTSTLATLGNSRTLDAIAQAAAAEGHTVKLMSLGKPTRSAVTRAFRQLETQAVEGLVVLVEEYDLDWPGIEFPADVPVVVVGSNPRAGYPAVDTDQAQGATLATEHLLRLGHETVWHIAGPTDSFAAEGREQAWRATLNRFDRPVPLPVVGDWSTESGYTVGRMLCHDPAVTAVFAANDQMALGLLRALHEAGRSVPGEVSVAGFDDMPEAASFWPPLTTVRQSFSELGRRVVRTLLDETATGIRAAAVDPVPVTLVVRGSTGPPW